jgi:hypothetical protein
MMKRTLFHKSSLIIHDRYIILGQVLNRLVVHFPQLSSNLGDEAFGKWFSEANLGAQMKNGLTEIVGDDHDATLKLVDGECKSVNGGHV